MEKENSEHIRDFVFNVTLAAVISAVIVVVVCVVVTTVNVWDYLDKVIAIILVVGALRMMWEGTK